VHAKSLVALPLAELLGLIDSLTEQMRNAASELQFELAARLRDEIKELKRELRAMQEGGM
jgi:excinuclease ABC subunit B